MTTAAIIGAGELGGAVAHALASRESVERVVLIDAAASAAAGKALDIQQMGAVSGVHTQLRGSSDLTDAIGCHVCIVADAFGKRNDQQADSGRELLLRLRAVTGDAPVVLAGADQTHLFALAAEEGLFPRRRLIGACTEALAASIRSIVALETHCAPHEVMLSVLGAPPPAAFVVAWSEASIGGFLVERLLTPVQLARLNARVERLWPPRPYTLGLAAATVAEGIVRSSRRAFNVLTILDGELGVRGRAGALPCFLDPTGIVASRVPSMSARERVRLDTVLGS